MMKKLYMQNYKINNFINQTFCQLSINVHKICEISAINVLWSRQAGAFIAW